MDKNELQIFLDTFPKEGFKIKSKTITEIDGGIKIILNLETKNKENEEDKL